MDSPATDYLDSSLWRFAWLLFAGGFAAGLGIMGFIWWGLG